MKVRLYFSEDSFEWAELPIGPEIEIPDAIMADFRECHRRLQEISAYFNEKAQPQIEAAHAESRRAWREAHPEEAARQDEMVKMWSKMLYAQLDSSQALYHRLLRAGVFTVDLAKVPGDAIVYDDLLKGDR